MIVPPIARETARHVAAPCEGHRRRFDDREPGRLSPGASASDTRWHGLADIPEIVIVSDAEGRVVYANARFHDYTGRPFGAALGEGWFQSIHAADRARIVANGLNAVADGAAWEADLRMLDARGESRWFRARAGKMSDRAGVAAGWIHLCSDIDDLKSAQASLAESRARLHASLMEQKATEGRWRELQVGLAQAVRLSTVAHMATTLAHELNQPLTAASTYAQAVARALETDDKAQLALARKAAAGAAEQILRAGDIVRGLRDFVTTGETERVPEDLCAVIEEAAAVALIGTKDARVTVRLSLRQEPAVVLVNRIQIQQVVLNLVRNAIEAMEGRDRRDMELTLHVEEPGFSLQDGHPDGGTRIAAERMAVICVSDTGPGVAPEHVEHLFKPCLSEKRGGMGVGLSISRTIVEAHGGRIWTISGQGGGAVFKFCLPVIGADHGRQG